MVPVEWSEEDARSHFDSGERRRNNSNQNRAKIKLEHTDAPVQSSKRWTLETSSEFPAETTSHLPMGNPRKSF